MGGGKGSEVRGKRASEEGGEEVMEEERVESGERLPGGALTPSEGVAGALPGTGGESRAVPRGTCPASPAG